jgi:hypothetical protein
MDERRARSILEELARRQRRASLLDALFLAQRAFVDDPARFKAALCTRRAGKSFCAGAYLVSECLTNPGCTCLYVGLTRETAKRVLVKDVLKVIDRDYNLGAKFNEVELSVTFPNGSVLYLLGVDASDKEREKLLGQKYRLVVVDEAASYRVDLRDMVENTLAPAMADQAGTIALIGTPGNIKGYFYEVTTGQKPRWSVHKWTAYDNPHIKWAEWVAEFTGGDPSIQDTPRYKQFILGQWVTDTTALIFPGYSPMRNDVAPEGLPDGIDDFVYVLGCDFGFRDATALTLVAYNRTDPTLWVVRSRKRTGLDVTQSADWIRRWAAKFRVAAMVADTSSRQVVEELRKRHGLPLEAAEKSGKAEAMIIMSSDFQRGRIRLLQPHCSELSDELMSAVWDERVRAKTGKLVEHPGCALDAIDSALYAWRRATNYASHPLPPKKVTRPVTDEEWDAFDDAECERMAAEERRAWYERDGL